MVHLFCCDSIDSGINVLAGFQFLLKIDQQFNTVNDHLDQFNFRETDTIGVGDVEGSVSRGSVDTTFTK